MKPYKEKKVAGLGDANRCLTPEIPVFRDPKPLFTVSVLYTKFMLLVILGHCSPEFIGELPWYDRSM